MRLLGVDYGRGRIGVALGDTDSRVATSLEIHQTSGGSLRSAIEYIAGLAKTEGITDIVVGLPFPLDDQTRETAQAKEIKVFIAGCRVMGLTVHEENETWSTRLAERQARAGERRGPSDDLAATAILQAYLDRTALKG
jgi:putative Holliday junction resolvase